MTSLELVDFINEDRKQQAKEAGAPFPSKGFAKLEHYSFMEKVPKVLGETAAQNFLGSYKGGDGSTRPCYVFPKREACLMAMSYSYELQAKGTVNCRSLFTATEPHEFTPVATASTARFNERATDGTPLPAAPR